MEIPPQSTDTDKETPDEVVQEQDQDQVDDLVELGKVSKTVGGGPLGAKLDLGLGYQFF